jgi:hypothetical protein
MYTKRRNRKRKTRRGGDIYMGAGIMVTLFGIVGPFVMSKIPSASMCKKKNEEENNNIQALV